MSIENVKNILKKHLDNIAFVQLQLLEIDNINEEIFESLCLPAVVVSDMPRSITNKINSITENVALNHDAIQKNMLNDIFNLVREIEKVEIGLKRLQDKERFLIEKKLLENLSWNETGQAFSRKFYYMSKDSMHKKVKNALYKLLPFLK